MPETLIALGPFDLFDVLGHGAMGVVWRGVHRAQQVPVAVKVMTAAIAREDFYVERFRREVEAMAGLDHPGIITVLDFGEVDEEAARTSGGKLVAGSPYLAMELASGGTLADLDLPLRWARLRPILLAVLDALAHAHAREVVHRDLKPANVLVALPSDGRPGLRLTDFGLAQAARLGEGAGARDGMVGTPQYMAPEQVMGHWRDQGPWTDLYAVGVLGWLLATGSPPFAHRSFFMLAQAHLEHAPPPLRLPEDYPPRFADWLLRLLAKPQRQRFRRAADAAWELTFIEAAPAGLDSSPPTSPLSRDRLMELLAEDRANAASRSGGFVLGPSLTLGWIAGDDRTPAAIPTFGPDGRPRWNVEVSTDRGPAVVDFDDDLAFRPTFEGVPLLGAEGGLEVAAQTAPDVDYDARLPPLPETWRQPDPAQRSFRLIGAGLGLFGLRAVPLVDRDDERNALWTLLARVRRERRAHVAIVRGPDGVGKSALVDWFVSRAHEVGSAIVLRAEHAEDDLPTEPLRRMVSDALVCQGLDTGQVRDRVRNLLRQQDPSIADYEPGALAEMIAPRQVRGPTMQTTHVRVLNPNARYAVVRRLLLRLAEERPVILQIENAEWGSDALSLVEHLLARGRRERCPVLVVLTVCDDALEERTFEGRQVRDLAALDGALVLRPGPLLAADQRTLIHRLLALDPQLAAQVLDRSGGNPLLAVQLIGDWVSRGVLRIGPSGFVLAPGERADLPDGIHAAWISRLRQLTQPLGGPATALHALELAAALGSRVSMHEWEGLCAALRLPVPLELLSPLTSAGLIRFDPDGLAWAFAHATLRESLERSARERGAFEAIHVAAADLLASRHPWAEPSVAERIARHLLAARESAQAIGPLLIAIEGALRTADFDRLDALWQTRERALDEIAAPANDPRRVAGALVRGRAWLKQGRVQDALACAAHLQPFVRPEHGRLYGDYLWLVGALALQRGDLHDVPRHMEIAMRIQEEVADRHGLARSWHLVGSWARVRGDLDHALGCLLHARDLYTAVGDVGSVGATLVEAADTWRRRGELQAAESLAQTAMERLEEAGDRAGLAAATSLRGDLARARGDFEAAERSYLDALELLRVIDSPDTGAQRVKLGAVLLARTAWPQARWMLEAGLEDLRAAGLRPPPHAWLMLLSPLARAADWNLWERTFAEAGGALHDATSLDPELTWALDLAAHSAHAAGAHDRARRLELLRGR